MSLYGLYLRNPSLDSISLSHMERTYNGAVQTGGLILIFLENWGNEVSLKKYKNFIYRLAIFMSLYGLYLSNPSTDLIFLLHMERTYIWAVQWGVNFNFIEIERMRNLWNLKNCNKNGKTCDKLHQDFHVNNFVLPQYLTVFCYTVMWYWFAFNCIPWLCDCCSAGDLVSFTDILVLMKGHSMSTLHSFLSKYRIDLQVYVKWKILCSATCLTSGKSLTYPAHT